MKHSMLRRLIANQLFVLVLFAALTTANLLWQFHREGAGEYDQHMKNMAGMFLRSIEPLRDKPDVMLHDVAVLADAVGYSLAMEKTRKPPGETEYQFVVRLLDASGKQLFQSPASLRLPADSTTAQAQDFELDGRRWRSRTLRSDSGAFVMQLAETEDGLTRDLADIVWKFIFVPMVLFLPIAGLLTWLVSRRGLSPLHDLAQMIAKRTPNDLQPLGHVTKIVETAPVVQEINALLDRLRATLAREREFLADAAHELRTPLAVVQAQSHVLHHAVDESDRRKAAQELDLGVGRAAGLINKLLVSARVSGEDFSPRLEMLELNALVQERVALLSSLATRKNIEMSLNANARVKVSIDRESFVSAVDNVIDNAIRYTPAGGNIEIEIVQDRGTVVMLRVADNGVGIPPELRERVFERFFRVDSSEQVGSGLGLAIVKRVLALHGGQVSLSTGLNQRGLAVALTLPTAA
jgi:two-component system, OmpR family, sensor histidine kinase QseC